MVEKIRVFCVDDDKAATSFYQLAFSFEPDMEFVGSRASTEDLLKAVEAAQPSILLLDLLIPGCDTLATLSELRARFPNVMVLVVSGLDDEDVVNEIFRRGASGFSLKTMDFSDLTAVIRRTAAGERVHADPRPALSFGG